MRDDERPLDVMLVQPVLDSALPLSLADRLRTAMTVHSLSHGARALALIEAGASPDIILVDRRTPGVDVAAMQRMLQRRTHTATTAISFIDGEHAVLRDAQTLDTIAHLHGLHSALPPLDPSGLPDRLHDGGDEQGDDDR